MTTAVNISERPHEYQSSFPAAGGQPATNTFIHTHTSLSSVFLIKIFVGLSFPLDLTLQSWELGPQAWFCQMWHKFQTEGPKRDSSLKTSVTCPDFTPPLIYYYKFFHRMGSEGWNLTGRAGGGPSPDFYCSSNMTKITSRNTTSVSSTAYPAFQQE